MERDNPFNLNSEEDDLWDVIIIGSGLSGLTAAYHLNKLAPELKFKILEAKDRTGGRIFTTELPAMNNTTDIWDMGGGWIGSHIIHPFINQLISELQINTYPQNFDGKKLLQTGKNFAITEYDSAIPDIGLLSLVDSATLIKCLDKASMKISEGSSSSKDMILKYDAITAETFIQSKTWTKCTFDCARSAIRGTMGSELNKISALYLIAFTQSCGGFFNLVESGEGSSQGYKISGGAHMICSRILEIIGVDKLQLETVVTDIERISTNEDNAYSLIRTSSGRTFKSKFVVLAIPPHYIPNIHFQPPLSPAKFEYFSAVTPAHSIKVILTYEKAFWIKDGYSGEIVTNGGKSQTEGCDSGPLCIVFDGTTDQNSPALICLICGVQALQYENKTKVERKEAVLKSLEQFFRKEDVRDFIAYSEKIWRHERYVGGCPTFTAPPGVAQHLNNNLRKSENGIYFAGSELATNWMGFMEGAVETGEKAALQILSNF